MSIFFNQPIIKRNDDVIEESIKPNLAFEHFAGKVYDDTPAGIYSVLKY